MTSEYAPFVFTKKTVAMQRLSDAVRTGYAHYVCGTIPLEKAAAFCEKQAERYRLSWSPVKTRAERKAGKAVYRLILLQEESAPDEIHWWLLRTEGAMSPEAGREKWRDGLRDKITIGAYELVRHTKAGADHPVWTWRMEKAREQALRDTLVLLIRQKRDAQLEQLIESVWRAPGFSGIRDQVKKLAKLLHQEWKRSRGQDEAMPAIPERIGYLRRLPSLGRRLEELLAGKPRERAVRKAKVVTQKRRVSTQGGGLVRSVFTVEVGKSAAPSVTESPAEAQKSGQSPS
ncbi:hypothetical protein HF292_015730 (plasmid) [Acidithiobacillus ferruginosus]|uniref:Uncharacterized protein n=1 Tax=Acidithiobacillus ferruginosus TaxID=3063951 RepID=A0ACD5ILN3_9PROT|nr:MULTISPECIES: hypothetical protein [Acidithiobacillus]MBU2804950.1 hypothetical protein [Acidithiobacillus ferridurans]MBU2813237.1 hypothetical protein [Acidithiobacillus ferruginosus]MBU2823680.1 hypothetical protein [Acidithiobacillus ferrooxidans]